LTFRVVTIRAVGIGLDEFPDSGAIRREMSKYKPNKALLTVYEATDNLLRCLGLPAGQMMMQDTAVPSTPEIGRPFTLNSSRLPIRQSETKTIAAGSVNSRRGSRG
jgi:hypothetical protein